MKAAISTRYGSPDVLKIQDVPQPVPMPGELLVKVRATTVSRTDCGMLEPHPFFIRATAGLLRPKHVILGMDFAGEVVRLGQGVSCFDEGDLVFGLSPVSFGAHAQYICVPERGLISLMPQGVRFDQVVVCEGAWYASTCLKWLGLDAGDKLLIYGGSGAIGTAAIQLAKSLGAHVTAVVSTQHLPLVKSLGADRVVDYTEEDFAQIDDTFDCVLDAVGKTTLFQCRPIMKPAAKFAATDLGPFWQNIFLAYWSSLTGKHRVAIPFPEPDPRFVSELSDSIEAGQFRPVIDRQYPLTEISDAYRYVQTGQKTGIVVINMEMN